MKFVLTLIMCSSVYNQCLPPYSSPDIYNSHYECVVSGYEKAHKKVKEIGPQEVNKYGTIIKFYCVAEKVIIPPPKPGLQT